MPSTVLNDVEDLSFTEFAHLLRKQTPGSAWGGRKYSPL